MYLEDQKGGFRVYTDDGEPIAEIEVFVNDEADEIKVLVSRLDSDPTVQFTVL